jgi:hypothetical protein
MFSIWRLDVKGSTDVPLSEKLKAYRPHDTHDIALPATKRLLALDFEGSTVQYFALS